MESSDPTTAAAIIVSPDRFHLATQRKEKCVVQITNVSFEAVLFRMLTTSPERYLVKPTKGIVRPHASVAVSIILNNAPVSSGGASNSKHDEFRLEYCSQGPDDVIEPHCSNVSALIKARKGEDRRLVHVKTLRCTIDAPDVYTNKSGSNERSRSPALSAVTDNLSDVRGGSEGMGTSASSIINPRELEQNTLAAKKRRQQDQKKMTKKRFLLLFAVVVALFGVWSATV